MPRPSGTTEQPREQLPGVALRNAQHAGNLGYAECQPVRQTDLVLGRAASRRQVSWWVCASRSATATSTSPTRRAFSTALAVCPLRLNTCSLGVVGSGVVHRKLGAPDPSYKGTLNRVFGIGNSAFLLWKNWVREIGAPSFHRTGFRERIPQNPRRVT